VSRSGRPPLRPGRTNAFKKDLERCRKRGYDMDIPRVVMGRLIHREPLETVYDDHPLKGERAGHRECPLEPDWLLIYRVEGDDITFERTGTHSDLFGE
jgi:mRNA interferase YafQ